MWANINTQKLIDKIATNDQHAFDQLTRFSGQHRGEIPIILRNLQHQDSGVRVATAIALCNFTNADFDPSWHAEEKIHNALTLNDCNQRMPLIMALGSVGTGRAFDILIAIANEATISFDPEWALDAIGRAGANAYPKIDAITRIGQESSDEMVKFHVSECLVKICDEIKNLYAKVCNNEQSLCSWRASLPGDVKIPGTLAPKPFNEDLTVLYDDRISFLEDRSRWFGGNSSSTCRLIVLSSGEFNYCIFSNDEFSYGVSVTNAAEYLIAGVKEKFAFDHSNATFVEHYARGQDTATTSASTIVLPPEPGTDQPSWIGGVMRNEVESLLRPYLEHPVPIPSDFNIEEQLRFYLPPESRVS